MLFIETRGFTKRVIALLDDDTLAQLQRRLAQNPEIGKVMPGCGGLRKVRVPEPKRGQGKRGGARIIYLHLPVVQWIFLLDVFSKGDQEDLTAAARKALQQLVNELREEAALAVVRGNGAKHE